MQKSKSVESVSIDLTKYLIQKEYLNMARHKQNLQYSRKCIYFYERFNTQIQGYYHIINSLPQKLKDKLQLSYNQPNNLLSKFKTFLNDFFQIFTLLSNFQIDGLSKIRSSLYDNLDNNFDGFINSLQKYNEVQVELQKQLVDYKFLCINIENKYAELQNTFKRVYQNFNSKLIKAEYDILIGELDKKQKLQQSITLKMQQIGVNSKTFEKEIMFYRQKLVIFKYESIQKINRLCKNAKQSIMQILTYMYDFIAMNKPTFAVDKRKEEIKSNPNINEKKDITQVINRCTRQYDQQINQYLEIIKLLISIFTSISQEIKDQKNRHMEIIQQMNKYFQFNECNVEQVLATMDSYKLFLKYLSQLGDKLIYSQKNLLFLQKNINKHKQIALTIIKCNKTSTQPYRQGEKAKQSDSNYLDNLFEQMNEIYILKNIEKIFHDFEETVIKIRQNFMINLPARKKVNNSMSMSYLQVSQIQFEKKPFKIDVWLWKEWRKEIKSELIDFPEIKSLASQMGKFIEKSNFEQKQSQKLNCIFLGKKINGVLKLKPQGLCFQSTDNTRHYVIPFYKIQNVDMDFNIMSKTFGIQTVHGILTFSDQNVKQIKKFYLAVKRALDTFNQNNEQGKIVQNIVALSEQEIEFIKSRRVKIEKDLQNLSQYQHYNTIVFEDVTINDVYNVLFSDNKIVLKGKQYECFMDSLMKKFNNFNQTYQKFHPIGPQFYTGVKGTDFKNCPVFSQRKIEFDHSLPKVPFFPSSCHNSQTARIYWVSHQQFHVRQLNMTSGAPYTQNFYITTFSTIHKVDQNVQVRFYIKITLVTDFALRKMVLKTSADQAKWGNGILSEQAKKIMLSYKRKNAKQFGKVEAMQESNFSDKTRVKQFKQQIQTLQQKNKILFYVLGGVLVLNILLKILF